MRTVSWPEGIEARSIEAGDADAWAKLLAAKEKIDQEGENYGPQDLIDQLNDPHLDAALDTIGLWAEGRMVAYGKAHAAESVIDVDRVRTEGTVHPHWRRRGVGTALMHWLIERAAALHRASTRMPQGRSATAPLARTSERTACCTSLVSRNAGTSST